MRGAAGNGGPYRNHFQVESHGTAWPQAFAIITAHATTGETWTTAENEAADQALHAELLGKSTWVHRVTGYSPATLHAEPGWAVALPFDDACEIGRSYRQDAIYIVTDDVLSVSYCDDRRKCHEIGLFSPRVHVSPGQPVVRPSYSQLCPPNSQLKDAIHGHPQFAAFINKLQAHFQEWRDAAARGFRELETGCHPKEIIREFSEHLLHHAEDNAVGLVDPYAIYQHLMDYWATTLQDDCYHISTEGWVAQTARILETDKKGKQKDKGWTCDLVPKPLIVARYFSKEQAAIEAQQAELEAASANLAELEEEHGGEDGFLGQLDKIAKAEVNARLKEIKGDKEAKEEAAVLQQWLKLSAEESELRRAIREAEFQLDQLAWAKYPQLSEAEIQTLVVDDKWLVTLTAAIQGELDRVSQTLTNRIRTLAERYTAPLPEFTALVADLESKVAAHLNRMGFAL